jgi:hypothetical protein
MLCERLAAKTCWLFLEGQGLNSRWENTRTLFRDTNMSLSMRLIYQIQTRALALDAAFGS